MENLLKQTEKRYVKYPDNEFSFSLLKSTNFFYLYLDTNNINGKININVSVKPTPLNTKPKDFPKNLQNKFLFKKDGIVFQTILTGIWEKDIFYFTDIEIYNGLVLNHNYRTRYLLLKKILNSFEKNECFSIIKSFSDTNLEQIITETIPKQNFQTNFILMKKDFAEYIVNFQEKNIKKEEKTKNQIEQYIKKPIILKTNLKVYKTKKTEIYLAEHKKEEFYCDDIFWKNIFEKRDIFYSVLRVKDIKTSKKLQKIFLYKNVYDINCVYNPLFEKYEIILDE